MAFKLKNILSKAGGVTKIVANLAGKSGIPIISTAGNIAGMALNNIKLGSDKTKKAVADTKAMVKKAETDSKKPATGNFFVMMYRKVADWYLSLPLWLKILLPGFLLFVVYWLFFRKKKRGGYKRSTKRRSTVKRASSGRKRISRGKTSGRSAFLKRMAAGKRRAARKRKK